MQAANKGADDAEKVRIGAVRAWTTSDSVQSKNGDFVTFFGCVQEQLRNDTLRFDGVRFGRSLNFFLSNRAQKRVSQCLPSTNYSTRCCWLSKDAVEWFVLHLVYRYAGYLASTDKPMVALDFLINTFRLPHIDVPVMFRFHFGEDGCAHVKKLEDHTTEHGENEWLFAPYSTFTVEKAADLSKEYSKNDPVCIDLRVWPCNKDAPQDTPLARWH